MSTPTFVLSFAGCISEGTGGCAAVCKREGVDEPLWTVSRRLGRVGSNAADYFGLIAGLRRMIQEIPLSKFNISILGSSEATLCEMIRERQVKSPLIQLYHQVANGLVKRIRGEVTWDLITKEENGEADYLAEAASNKKVEDGEFFVFYPSLMNLCEADLQGTEVVAGHDAGTAARTPEVLVDAGTVSGILGVSALEGLQDPGMTTVVSGKTSMTVLGILTGLTFTFQTDDGPFEVTVDDAVVVDFLPYNLQISIDHPRVNEALGETSWSISSSTGLSFDRSVVPDRFHSHPYWSSGSDAGRSTVFIASGHGLD